MIPSLKLEKSAGFTSCELGPQVCNLSEGSGCKFVMKRPHSPERPCRDVLVQSKPCTTKLSRLRRQHPRLNNTELPGCIVRQGFDCVVVQNLRGKGSEAQHDQCLSIHPNGLAVVQLAPNHPAVGTGERKVVQLNFEGEGLSNVLQGTKVKGKKKKGAMQLQADSILCTIVTEGGEEYKVRTGIAGDVIEVNTALQAEPGVVSSDPLGCGWFAILRLKPKEHKRVIEDIGSSV
ncbi:unnamed protein product [Discosporangium mesarthrocarpum]